MVTESIAPDAIPKISRRARLQTDKVTGKPVLLYPEGVLVLNETGMATVTLCTGECTVEEIAGKLAEHYKTSLQTILPEVTSYLTRLRARNLLEISAQKDLKP
jgi:pyrroloquinoline quinone biosynthesis protein D